MAFEAQDEYYIAKILVQNGVEVPVGSPIMITVEDKASVSRFANYVATTASAPVPEARPAPVSPPPSPSPPVAAVQAPVKATLPAAAAPTTAPVARAPVPHTVPQTKASIPLLFDSPMASKLANDQSSYVSRWGRTGHMPLSVNTKK